MEISYLPTKKLINAVRKIEGQEKVESDFFLRAVRIRNTTNKPARILEYVFDLKTKGKTRKRIQYPEEIVKEQAELVLKFAEKIMKKQDNPLKEGRSKRECWYGYRYRRFLGL